MRLEHYLHDELVIASTLVVMMAFVWVNVSPEIGGIYAIFTILYFITISSRGIPQIEIITKGQNLVKSLLIPFLVFGFWIIASYALVNTAYPQTFGALDVNVFFRTLKTQTEIPVLSSDITLIFLIYGIFVPIIESMFFLSFVLLLWCKILKLPLPVRWHNFKSPYFVKMLWVCLLIGASASLFHWRTRMASDYALLVDFLFFTVSAFLVFRSQVMSEVKKPRLFEAILVHIFVNSGVILVG